MRYFDKTFFKFLLGFSLIIIGGLLFISRVEAALNINTATFEELQTLDGIGAVKAQAIIDYRNGPNGPFELLEELMEVSGIGEATFENLRDSIFVSTGGSGEEDEDNKTNISNGGARTSENGSEEEPKELKVKANGAKVGVVGLPVKFEASSNRRSVKSSAYSWSLGDGGVAVGEEVDHIYQYPGEYIVVVRVEMRDEEAVSRLNVKIIPDTLKISATDQSRIEVWNDGDFEVDLFGREIVSGGKTFAFPEYTIIKPNQKISFPSSITGLSSFGSTNVSLNIINDENKFDIETKEITRKISREDQAKIKQIREQIASLQLKQMELKRVEESKVRENFASASLPQDDASASTSEESDSDSWVDTLKKFFGFK